MSYRAPPGMTSSHLRSYHDPNVVHTPVTNYSVSPFWNPASAVVSLPPAAVGTRSITMNRSTRSSTASAAHYQAHALSRPSHIPTVQAITPTYSIASATTYQAPVLPRLSQFPAVKDQAPTHRSERPRTYHNSIYPMPPPPSSPRPRTPSTPPPHADVHPTSTPPPPQGIREYYITFQTRFAPALDITIIKALLWPRRHLWSDNSTEFTLARDTTRLYEVRIPIVAHHFCSAIAPALMKVTATTKLWNGQEQKYEELSTETLIDFEDDGYGVKGNHACAEVGWNGAELQWRVWFVQRE